MKLVTTVLVVNISCYTAVSRAICSKFSQTKPSSLPTPIFRFWKKPSSDRGTKKFRLSSCFLPTASDMASDPDPAFSTSQLAILTETMNLSDPAPRPKKLLNDINTECLIMIFKWVSEVRHKTFGRPRENSRNVNVDSLCVGHSDSV